MADQRLAPRPAYAREEGRATPAAAALAPPRAPRIAIVHEWLQVYGGSERVLEQLLRCFPVADLFAVVDFVPAKNRAFLQGRPVTTTFVQKLPGARRLFRHYLGLMPMAIEQLDLSGYDVVISSNHAVAKGVLTGPDQIHISYVHSPMRYIWDLQHQYLRQSQLGWGLKALYIRWLFNRLRLWDYASAQHVDHFIANSRYIARRVKKAYGRAASVIHPPVDVTEFTIGREKEDFFLLAGRFVPYKRADLVVRAFRDQRIPRRRAEGRTRPSHAACPRRDLRGRGGFRHRHGGGAGLWNAGHRLREGWRAGHHRDRGGRRPDRRALRPTVGLRDRRGACTLRQPSPGHHPGYLPRQCAALLRGALPRAHPRLRQRPGRQRGLRPRRGYRRLFNQLDRSLPRSMVQTAASCRGVSVMAAMAASVKGRSCRSR
jgi:hypothetical protein